jgi:hypothetical protein
MLGERGEGETVPKFWDVMGRPLEMKRLLIVLSVFTAGLMTFTDARSGTELVRFGEILGGVAREFSANPAKIPVLGAAPDLLRALSEADRVRNVPVMREVLLYLRNDRAISPSSAAAYLCRFPAPPWF